MDIKDYVKMGYDKNIVVFDSQAKPGEFTDRLKDLMKEVMKNNFHCNIDVFFKKDTYENWNEIENYYLNELNGSYAEYDSNLVVAVSVKNNEVILGSF